MPRIRCEVQPIRDRFIEVPAASFYAENRWTGARDTVFQITLSARVAAPARAT